MAKSIPAFEGKTVFWLWISSQFVDRTAAAMILGAVYAYPPIEIGDPVVQKVENYVDRMLKAALPG